MPDPDHPHEPPADLIAALRAVADARPQGQFPSAALLGVLADVRTSLPQLASEAGLQARREGATWGQIAESLGYGTAARAQQVVDPRVREGKKAADRARRASERAPQSASTPLPGISVAEAARRAGVSRATVYARIKAGRYQGVEVAGKTRVLAGPPELGL